MTFVMLVNIFWHGLGAYYFSIHPGGILAKYSSERPISPVAITLLQAIGGLNAGLFLLAVFTLAWNIQPAKAILLFFALTNLTQVVCDYQIHRSKLGNKKYKFIIIGDTAVAFLNAIYFFVV